MQCRTLRLAACLSVLAAGATGTIGATAAASQSAAGAALDAIQPPPGLYRVDTDVAHGAQGPGGRATGIQARQDGAGGGETVRLPNPDGAALVEELAGTGQVTRCVRGRQAPVPVPAGCSAAPPSVVDGAEHLAAQCPGADIAMVIRKTGPATWEYRTTVSRPVTAGAGANDGLPMPRSVLEYAAGHGTAEQRAKAARLLADHDAQPRARQAPSGAASASAGARQVSTIVQVATRIADTCAAR